MRTFLWDAWRATKPLSFPRRLVRIYWFWVDRDVPTPLRAEPDAARRAHENRRIR